MPNRLQAYRFNLFEISAIKRLYSLYGRKLSLNRLPMVYLLDYEELQKLRLARNKNEDHDRLHREISSSDLSNPDFLGKYVYKSGEEGRIILFRDRIDSSARFFSNLLRMKFEETRDMIKYIVLIHELGHWLSHRICLENQRDIYSKLSKNLKEAMAQLHIPWSLQGLSSDESQKVRELFFALVQRQPPPYADFIFSDPEHAHLMNEKSFKNRVILLNRFIKISKRRIPNDFWFFLTGDIDCHGHFQISLKTGESLPLGWAGNTLIFD